ncbi:MAG: hypothetical protein A4E64_02626 [Syntrophorhabdus sp. PtaU1.Bin058]|nr:MAG: hypothetical protein A4E64_02626 [Syntrophorhabdus sp. PtaU1.Bin058]
MLILSRKKDETILIKGADAEIRVMVVEVGKGKIRLGIDAPKGYVIVREELLEEVQRENRMSALSDIEAIRHMLVR